MNEFVEVPASQRSLSCRKTVQGVGINDVKYKTEYTIGRKRIACPYYTTWSSMLSRCYSKSRQKMLPTYNGCTVVKEWFMFSNFRKWMLTQEWEGKALDKDIIKPGNKIYSPETCVFVKQEVNALVCGSDVNRWKHQQGVHDFKKTGRFQVYCTIKGVRQHLGYFSTSDEASSVYNTAKSKEILRVSNLQSDVRVRNGLLKHVEFRCNS